MMTEVEKPGEWGVLRILGKTVLVLCVGSLAFGLTFIIKYGQYFEASVRSPYSRAQADIRTLVTGLEVYWIDHDTYPNETWRLTTPIAYLARLPLDGCSKDRTKPFIYYTDGESYIVASRGPDRVFQIDPERDFHFAENRDGHAPALNDKCFDPSNGSKSAGDIFLIGPTARNLEKRVNAEKGNPADGE